MIKCPGCGQLLSPNAKGCSKCGAGVLQSWDRNESFDGLDLPEEDEFDYNQFVESEFGRPSIKPKGISWFWWGAAILAAIVFAKLILGI